MTALLKICGVRRAEDYRVCVALGVDSIGLNLWTGSRRYLDPEAALRVALNRFSDRFEHAEASAASKGQTLRELDEAALDALWEDAKRALRGDRGDG